MNTTQRTVHFVSLGCPKNRVDSEVMAGVLSDAGLLVVATPEEADVIVVNTCGFIDDARSESVDVLLDMAAHKQQGRCRALVATGCLVQKEGDALRSAMPEIDAVLGTGDIHRIADVLDGRTVDVAFGSPTHFLQTAKTPRFVPPGAPSAYIKISDGCNRRCAFCAIPHIKGAARSRPVDDIAAEAAALADAGVREVVLVAQDIGAYRDPTGAGLCDLLRRLDTIDSVRWIRLLYLYPDALDEALLSVMAHSARIAPYVDVPIQHASDAVLRAMRRGIDAAAQREALRAVRRWMPHAFLRTTVLVGFPGETDDDVARLVDFMEEMEFDHLGAFRYNPQPGTAAWQASDPVPAKAAYNRWRKVMAAQRRIAERRARSRLGSEVDVLVEDTADAAGYVLVGRHVGQAPEVDGVTYLTSARARPGDVVRARLTGWKQFDYTAEAV